jgi:GMP synthase (glutamine-hydrolysing)
MSTQRVLIVRTGSAPDAVRAVHGDFDAWFAALLAPARVELVEGAGASLPDPAAFDGILVTGSLASVTAREPWMETLGRWLVLAAERTPVLGVCFGHQLLAAALGGHVERHPAGPEAGTTEIVLTPEGRADPLFEGLPARLRVQQSHEDHVPAAPPGAVVLAANAHAPVQAFARGPRIRAVQFHPELDAPRARAFVEADRAWLERARPGAADAALASVRDSPDATRVIANWRSRCLRRP